MEHAIPVMTAILATVIGILLTAILIWLSRLGDKLNEIDEKLDTKVSDETCKERTSVCQTVRREKTTELKNDTDELWDALNTHSHTGLALDSKVIR